MQAGSGDNVCGQTLLMRDKLYIESIKARSKSRSRRTPKRGQLTVLVYGLYSQTIDCDDIFNENLGKKFNQCVGAPLT